MVLKFNDANPAQTRRFVTSFMDSPESAPFWKNPAGQPGIFVYDVRKPLQGLHAFGFQTAEYLENSMDLEDGDLVVLQARPDAPFAGGSTPLGNLRLALHKAAAAHGLLHPSDGFKFLWVTDFPFSRRPTTSTQGKEVQQASNLHTIPSPRQEAKRTLTCS